MGLLSRVGRKRRVLVLMAVRLCRLGGGESNAHEGHADRGEEMRIADVLHEGEDEPSLSSSNNDSSSSSRRRRRGGGGQRRRGTSSTPSPLWRLSRWLPSKQFLRCRACDEDGKEEVVRGQAGVESGEVRGVSSLESTAGAHMMASADREDVEEEVVSNLEAMALSREGGEGPVIVGSEERSMQGPVWKPEQTYLNIGMGVGLVLLLTRSVAEFNKMIELRSEMEILLKKIKDVVQKKDESPDCVDPKNNFACCSSDLCGNMEWSGDLSVHDCKHDPCLELVEGSCSTGLDVQSICDKGCHENRALRIDQMEELESELEHLRLNLDREESSELLSIELPCEKSDVSECFHGGVWEHPERKEQTEDDEEATRDHYGICPQELTSRLHELLETQQQERIAELESALELSKIKLREKEMEVCWWRDTALLVSQHRQETLFR